MTKDLPGILNNVIGPVMRGPSSSHTAACWRIAKVCMDILGEPLKRAVIDFDKRGAWTTNYREQGTVMGINGGLLGIDITDKRMKDTEALAVNRDVEISYEVNSFPTKHANTVRLSLEGTRGNSVQIVAASLGGGSFEIQQMGDFELSIQGNYFELLVLCDKSQEIRLDQLKRKLPENMFLDANVKDDGLVINIKSSIPFTDEIIDKLNSVLEYSKIQLINPVLPVVAGKETEMPFQDIPSLLEYALKENKDLGELGILYESCQSGLERPELLDQMKGTITIIEDSISIGLEGTQHDDRILPSQSHLIGEAAQSGKILKNTIVNQIIANVSAIMESKSAMEVIVANPTAGSCGTIGGVLKAVADAMQSTPEEIAKAYFAAGITGAFFAAGPGFSAEEHGCQVECGAASAMAAAGVTQLYGGTAKQAIDAASMALQNMIGLICDPVADRVEVPCLGKNINAAVNGLTAATMACSGFDAIIPYHEVIETVSRVSKHMPTCVKCTGNGGLAITPASIQIKNRFKC